MPPAHERPGRRRLALWLTTITGTMIAMVAIASPANAALRDSSGSRFIGYAANASLLCNNTATCTSGSSASYRNLAATEFSQVTPENSMKWEVIEPSNNAYNWTQADGIVAFAQANNQQVHGHTLVWHSQTPSYVQNLSASAMLAEMQQHITAEVGRYANNPAVVSWDVVNEAISDSGGTLRSSFWLNTIGESYIASAFTYARAADPDADLCINDYGIEGQNAKSNRLYTLVQSLLQQNVPVTCVGFQSHLVINQIPSDFQANLQRFANLGLKVRITELDIRIPLPSDAQELQTQAANYTTVVNACKAVTTCVGITTWGIDDGSSWLPNSCCGGGNEGDALLWNASYQAKPAYAAVNTALGGGSNPPQVPGTPGTPTASNVTASSLSLSWTASSGTVTSYQVERATGASSTTFTPVGTPTSPSFSDSGLAASTTYRYRVRATNSAGSSAYSAITNVTTSTTGGGGGCTATYVQDNSWPGGFQGTVTVTNTGSGSTTGWSVGVAFGGGQTITQLWNGQLSGSGPYTVANLSYNGGIGANASTSFGFLGGGSTGTPTLTCTRTP